MLRSLKNIGILKPKFLVLIHVLVALVVIGLTIFSSIKVDTDPENMLSETESVRVFHNKMRKEFNLYDMLVVGVVAPKNAFNTDTLKSIHLLSEYIKDIEGVISSELLSPSTVDSIENAAKGVVKFDWLMKLPPRTNKEAEEIYKKASRIPFLNGTLVSEDKKAVILYVPIKSKNLSYKISEKIKSKVKDLKVKDKIFITGLPIAQDTFGIEMFKQMAISAPIAMLFIFILMYFFFRNFVLIISPMIVAMFSVIVTMGLLIITGNTIHIMSSMIPIFIMPIAVLDAVHILSDFFDTYHKFNSKKEAVKHVMNELFTPMLYTSITTVIGFASLAFTPIPPVKVFGIFVALGVGIAWLSTITFVPAYIMLMNKKHLENFGLAKDEHDRSFTARVIHWFGRFTYSRARLIIMIIIILSGVAYYGIRLININDNPVKWFSKSHPIRVADTVLNKSFSGTYMAYFVLEANFDNNFLTKLAKKYSLPTSLVDGNKTLENFKDYADDKDEDSIYNSVDKFESELQLFKKPETLYYLENLQNYLNNMEKVGKVNSIVDIVKTVYRDLVSGNDKDLKIPKNSSGVAQTLLTFQNSHRPGDLWHFVNPSFTRANIWLQLKSGDNQDMSKIVESVENYLKVHPLPTHLSSDWFGMTYINVVWQKKMVNGMLNAFLGSFLIVMLLMIFLFRSAFWASLAMLPLTITIGGIYGIIGFIGKDYDMPIAVLSSLSLGLAVDYAIHFLARAKELRKNKESWRETIYPLFGEPSRAIFRNVIVISIGFMPLLFAPLIPYQTVGFFISAILFLAGAVTLAVLPSMLTIFSRFAFKECKYKFLSPYSWIIVSILVLAIILQNIIF
jgi:predicted RND superfamily exporter protein